MDGSRPLSDSPPQSPIPLDALDLDNMTSKTDKQFATAILEVVNGSEKGPSVATRTASGGIQTSQGTIYVSKPMRSSSKKLRAMVAFTPRKSHFDLANERSGANEFRGFFTLFWISMFLMAVRTYVRSIETNGYALNFGFATMFSEDAITLALSDAVLVASTLICVPFAQAVANGWIQYYWTGLILQHIWQTSVLFLAITWTFDRHWPWVQSGFLTLHTLVMLMKMHSYMNINGYLQYARQQAQELKVQLRKATEAVGGWDKAIATAKARRKELDQLPCRVSDVTDGASTPSEYSSTSSSSVPAHVDATLRKRANAVASESPSPINGVHPTGVVTTGNRVLQPDEIFKPGPHLLVDHPDERIASLAREFSDIDSDLVSTGPHYIRWPDNITYMNFLDYLLIPTLVYELEYPRTDRIRPMYVFEKTIATFGTFALLYTVTESFILPLVPTREQSFLRSLLDLSIPFMIAYLLLFYLIFECICNGFAELSRFADRQFYEDWWNATSWDEFSRKWNKPVHTFLLRHVYASSMSSYKLSKQSAMFFTFLLSAAVHELVMAIVTKKIRMYLFTLQLIQIPLIAIGRIPIIKRNKLLGNTVFWIGLYAGFPLLNTSQVLRVVSCTIKALGFVLCTMTYIVVRKKAVPRSLVSFDGVGERSDLGAPRARSESGYDNAFLGQRSRWSGVDDTAYQLSGGKCAGHHRALIDCGYGVDHAGTICWTVQLIPQIWKSWRNKSTDGLSHWLVLVWGLAGAFLGVYVIVQDLNIPLIVQPQVFGFLSLFSWAQCMFYDKHISLPICTLMFISLIAVSGGFEAGMVFAVRPAYHAGNIRPVQFFGIFSSVMISLALFPQYWEIYRRREVVGISILFMFVDMMGGVFSTLSLIFKTEFDVIAGVTYSLVVVLDGIVLLLALILNPMAKRRRAREAAADAIAAQDISQCATLTDVEQKKQDEEDRKHLTLAENVLGTMGTVCWMTQLLPQIWKSYREKSTKGLSDFLGLLWGISGAFLGVYAIVQNLNIPLIVQPQVLSVLSLLSWTQCQYYDKGRSLATSTAMFLTILLILGGFEAGMVFAIRPAYHAGNHRPIQFFGIMSSILLSSALFPQYCEIYKYREVIGISILFMTVDFLGGIFSDLSLAFKPKFDVIAGVAYSLVVLLDGIVILLALILNPIARRRRRREAEALAAYPSDKIPVIPAGPKAQGESRCGGKEPTQDIEMTLIPLRIRREWHVCSVEARISDTLRGDGNTRFQNLQPHKYDHANLITVFAGISIRLAGPGSSGKGATGEEISLRSAPFATLTTHTCRSKVPPVFLNNPRHPQQLTPVPNTSRIRSVKIDPSQYGRSKTPETAPPSATQPTATVMAQADAKDGPGVPFAYGRDSALERRLRLTVSDLQIGSF
ncbi:hypothetical protein NM688_g5710 [Phlebia brevispora]|uniref:Uncharacterized protein n=1 Tax=Phlebia brevispora TaxID=194682 RepID=A0ACC1SR38_9APHY|nr:hypothetical protein NM688_g5710 [Phlebia brevispora]